MYSRISRSSRYIRYSRNLTAAIQGTAAPAAHLTLTCQFSGRIGEEGVVKDMEEELVVMEKEMETAKEGIERFYRKFMM